MSDRYIGLQKDATDGKPWLVLERDPHAKQLTSRVVSAHAEYAEAFEALHGVPLDGAPPGVVLH